MLEYCKNEHGFQPLDWPANAEDQRVCQGLALFNQETCVTEDFYADPSRFPAVQWEWRSVGA